MHTSTLCTHLYIVICEGVTIHSNICNVVDVLCMVSSDSRFVSAVCACSPVELCAWHVV